MSAGASAHAPERPVARKPHPPFTEELEDFRMVVRRFIERELRPHAREWEDARWFPNEVFKTMAAQGYLGLKYEEEYGGQGGGYLADAVLTEEMGRCGSGGLAAGIGAHIGIATPPVWKFGTEDQKQRYLVPAIQGDKIAALGITEPDAGSDVAGLKTMARRVEGGWVVNGSKTYITNGVRADFIVTAVKTTQEGGHGGISFLIIDRGPGVESSKLDKMGWHASDTGLISFDDVFVPEENLLGELNRGFKLIMANFQWERLLMALGSVGAMQFAFERTLDFAKERTAFGRPIGNFQVTRHKFAEMATTIEAGRAITYNALRLFVNGVNAVEEVTMAKLATQRACFELMDECLQIHGGSGYMAEYDFERAARDARLGPIGGGTDEIMKEILGKVIGL
jgi:acyl-CoA dehydrogenase